MMMTCIYCNGSGSAPAADDPNECGFCIGGRADRDQAAAAMAGVYTVVERLTKEPKMTEITTHTEYWSNGQHAWRLCGDYSNGGTIDHVPTSIEQAREAAESAWGAYIRDWTREDDASGEEPAASYRLVWSTTGADDLPQHLATVEIDVVRDNDDDIVIGWELGAVELYQPEGTVRPA